MFAGQYDHTLDSKGRLIIPAKLRQVLLKESPEILGFWATVGVDKCLYMYSPSGWNKIIEHFAFDDNPFQNEPSRQVERWFFSNAQFLEVDKTGRVNMPAQLLGRAQISDRVILAGVNKRVEVWAPALWDEYQAKVANSFTDFVEAAQFKSHGSSTD
ncbi:MAG: division/cell wall cluster transcriptional repressor MraZ [Planctomycetota bacterium]|nr:division/cell wall cluster transcriptional repressor MraZ [Planctomycetota bacterium]MDA1140757.1 division/cell wall cluster transcriptional repressor MraZ [Planctomycetota bacterium]